MNRFYLMNFRDLKGWYFGSGRFVSAKRVRVNAHPTGRYTIGHLVRIHEVARNIDIIEVSLPHTPMNHNQGIDSLRWVIFFRLTRGKNLTSKTKKSIIIDVLSKCRIRNNYNCAKVSTQKKLCQCIFRGQRIQ